VSPWQAKAAAMFVRVKKIGGYEYLYLVENVREGGRHVQRVIKALGRRDEVEAAGLLDSLMVSAARHSRRTIVLSSFYRGELAEIRRRSIGPDLVFGHLWRESGCQAVLRRHLAGRRFGFAVERAIYLTVVHRLMVSGSDRHASTWQQMLAIPGVKDLMLDHAYEAMAWLGEAIEGADNGQTRHCTDAIEEALYQHRRSLFGAISVAFFDTTSLYFEGDGGARLGQLGHSKDFRPQFNQVVLGIVLDEQDRPIASFLWPGNTADVTTLLPVVERLRSRFGVERACLVADRGMISAGTIAALEARKIDYILGARERSSKEVRESVLHDDGAAVPLSIPRQKGETDLAVTEVKVEGRRYIVCRNEEGARRMRKPAPSCSPACSASWQAAPRPWWATPATAASSPHLAATGSPSIRRRSRPMRSSMACSCCAPACRCQHWPWCCATATCCRLNKASSPQRPC
jgi:Transposase DDE domain